MSDPQKLAPLLLCPFVIQPILIGVYAQTIQERTGAVWGPLAFVLNLGIVAFFECHIAAQTIVDAAAEVGAAITLSTIVIFATLTLLGGGPQARARTDFSINLRRGLFRIWVLISGPWIIFCVIKYLNACFSRYTCGFFGSGTHPIYFDIGKGFFGVPVLAFVVCLALCWVIVAAEFR